MYYPISLLHFFSSLFFFLSFLLIIGDEIKLKLHEKIDVNVLETSLGGDDDRPFVSSEYLQADFSRDFSAILNDAKEKYGKPEN